MEGPSLLSRVNHVSLSIFEATSKGMRHFHIGPGILRIWTVAVPKQFVTWSPCINVGSGPPTFSCLVFADFPLIIGINVRWLLAEVYTAGPLITLSYNIHEML